MKRRITGSLLVAVAAMAIFSAQVTQAAKVVDVDATTLGVADGTDIPTLSNAGTASDFTTNSGVNSVVTASHPANNNPGIMVQGAQFNGAGKMVSDSGGSHNLDGNNPHTVAVWAWNQDPLPDEETLVSWGHRGGPIGSNMGFHYGNHGTFGAVGHWGGGAAAHEPDVSWGAGDINGTTGQWTHLAYVYDDTVGAGTSFVYINGTRVHSEEHVAGGGKPAGLVIHGDDLIALGAESNNGDPFSRPIPLSATIGKVEVWNSAMSDGEIEGLYDAGVPVFVEGIPEPSTMVLAVMGLMSLFALRRRRRR